MRDFFKRYSSCTLFISFELKLKPEKSQTIILLPIKISESKLLPIGIRKLPVLRIPICPARNKMYFV